MNSMIRIQVCQKNIEKHKSTREVWEQTKEVFPAEACPIEYVEVQCGGICGVCRNVPYVLVCRSLADKKLISGITPEQFAINVKEYVNRLVNSTGNDQHFEVQRG
jgi:uncharacterized protein YuzB (UPF0349 family)